MDTIKNNQSRSSIFVLIGITVILFLLLKNSLFSPFNVEDDHLYISIANPGESLGHKKSFWDGFLLVQKSNFKFGRFQPLFITSIYLKARFLGANPFLNHLEIFLNTIALGFLIFIISKRWNCSVLVSVTTSMVFLLGHAYAEIFWRLSAAESHGLLFLLLAIFYLQKFENSNRNRDFSFAIFLGFISTLFKESFIVLFPLVMLIPFVRRNPKTYLNFIKQYKYHFIVISILFFSDILGIWLVILYSGKVFSYGQPLTVPQTIINNLQWLTNWFLPFGLVVLIVLILMKKKIKMAIPLLLFLLVCFCSQIVIYYKTIISYSQGRYIMPAGLVLIFLFLFCLDYLEKNHKKIFFASLVFVSLVLFRNAKITFINSNEYSAKATAFQLLSDELIKEKPEKIAIYGGYEFLHSINTNFKIAHYYPKIISTPLLPDINDSKNPFLNKEFEEAMQKELDLIYENKTVDELKIDSSIKVLITSLPKEYKEINFLELSKVFPHKKEIYATFANVKFGDLISPKLWSGELKNDQRTYIIFSR